MAGPHGAWLLAAGLAVTALVLIAPHAGAGVEGNASYDLTSLSEADIEAELVLTGEEADRLRERADHDDDGQVSTLEAAGARTVIDDRLQGPTEAYELDGTGYTNEAVSVSTDELSGPVDAEVPVQLDLQIEATADPDQAPHTFAVHGLPGNLTESSALTVAVHAPEGYVVAASEGFETMDPCRAEKPPAIDEAHLELEASSGDCSRPIPAASAAMAAGLLGLAGLVLRRRDR